MRNLIIAFLIIISITSSALHAQNNDYLVTMDGIGTLKLDMKQAEVEKLLNKKFTLKNMSEKDGSWMDTVKTKYKNTDITLYFERVYDDETNFHMALAGIMANSPLYKTKTGLGIGADKLRIIGVYEFNRLEVFPDYEDEEYTRISKTLSSIYVYADGSENALVFHLRNKKVISIEIMHFYGD